MTEIVPPDPRLVGKVRIKSISAREAETNATKTKFELIAFASIKLDRERRNYIIKGLLSNTGIGVIWGPPKCGKSFWAFDLAMHIALGWQYRGRRVQQCPVIYIALEGQQGFPARVEAFRLHHGLMDDDAPFFLMTTALSLTVTESQTLVGDIRRQLGSTKPGAIFIDTLNRSLVGSESKDEDMARYIAGADAIGRAFDCKVELVHHCGVDGTRPRGHTSLTGSVEEQIAVVPEGDHHFTAKVEHAKDMAEGAEIASRLEPVTLGIDPDGDPITSLVVVPAVGHRIGRKGHKLKGQPKIAFAALMKALDEEGQPAPASNHIPQTRTISVSAWRRYADLASITDSDNPDSKRRAFVRVVRKLQAAEVIGIWQETVWVK